METVTVPQPPTAGLPGYEVCSVWYFTGVRAYPDYGGADYAEIAEKAAQRWCGFGRTETDYPVHAAHLSPDGHRVVGPAWAGGTWGRRCGSTCWVPDADRALAGAYRTLLALEHRRGRSIQASTYRDFVSTSQAWWLWKVGKYAEQGGFHVECQQPYRHEGLCTVEGWRWDHRAEVPILSPAR